MPIHSTSPFDRDRVIDPDPHAPDPNIQNRHSGALHDRTTAIDFEAEADLEAWIAKHMPDPAASKAPKPNLRPLEWSEVVADFCTVLVLGTRFAVGSFLVVLGLPVFVFLLLMGWDLGLLLASLGGLAEHYEAAGPLRRMAFSQDTQIVFLVAVGLVALLRLPRFARELFAALEKKSQP